MGTQDITIDTIVLLAGTIGGWCPGALLARRFAAPAQNTRGIPEARQQFEL